MKNYFLPIGLSLIFLLSSCMTTGFKDFYQPWDEEGLLPTEAYLQMTEESSVIKCSDLNSKFREIASNWYWCIGYSGFNGPDLSDHETRQELINLCKEIKAKVAIYSKRYTDTKSGVYSTPHNNYHHYTDINGFFRSYITTSYTTNSYSIDRYDFSSYFFVPIPEDYKIMYAPGFSVVDLSQADKDFYKQNTGCLIYIVYNSSPAYFSNLVYGDIITRINNKDIYSANDILELQKISKNGDIWNITILRNGMEKDITVKYGI